MPPSFGEGPVWDEPGPLSSDHIPLPDHPDRLALIERVVRMRLDKMSYRAISEQVGVNIRTLSKWVSQYMRDFVPVEDLDTLRAQESDMLDRMDTTATRLLATMNEANQARHKADPLAPPAYEPDALLRVFDRIVRIQERRAKLMGLDAALKIDTRILLPDGVDAEIEALVEQMAGGAVMSDPTKIPEGLAS